jgi:hypothetical protein
MYKTNKIFAKYLKVLEEQVPDNVAPGLGENEKYIIKILTNAFIFNPTVFSSSQQKYIASKIEAIKKMVNVPIAKVVDEIKKIIALDNSLKVESKTFSLLTNYMLLIEQPADATEPQAEESTPLKDLTKQAEEEQVSGEGNNLNLEEIFPLYKELIIKALNHSPTEEELMIIKPIVNEFADVDPEKIIEAIQNVLSQSLEDKEVEDNLSNA